MRVRRFFPKNSKDRAVAGVFQKKDSNTTAAAKNRQVKPVSPENQESAAGFQPANSTTSARSFFRPIGLVPASGSIGEKLRAVLFSIRNTAFPTSRSGSWRRQQKARQALQVFASRAIVSSIPPAAHSSVRQNWKKRDRKALLISRLLQNCTSVFVYARRRLPVSLSPPSAPPFPGKCPSPTRYNLVWPAIRHLRRCRN